MLRIGTDGSVGGAGGDGIDLRGWVQSFRSRRRHLSERGAGFPVADDGALRVRLAGRDRVQIRHGRPGHVLRAQERRPAPGRGRRHRPRRPAASGLVHPDRPERDPAATRCSSQPSTTRGHRVAAVRRVLRGDGHRQRLRAQRHRLQRGIRHPARHRARAARAGQLPPDLHAAVVPAGCLAADLLHPRRVLQHPLPGRGSRSRATRRTGFPSAARASSRPRPRRRTTSTSSRGSSATQIDWTLRAGRRTRHASTTSRTMSPSTRSCSGPTPATGPSARRSRRSRAASSAKSFMPTPRPLDRASRPQSTAALRSSGDVRGGFRGVANTHRGAA